jgi:PAS domain S-box-containing protein
VAPGCANFAKNFRDAFPNLGVHFRQAALSSKVPAGGPKPGRWAARFFSYNRHRLRPQLPLPANRSLAMPEYGGHHMSDTESRKRIALRDAFCGVARRTRRFLGLGNSWYVPSSSQGRSTRAGTVSVQVFIAALVLVGVLSFPALVRGEPPSDQKYLIDIWGADEGLPQSGATSIVQTPDGYLWFGTFNGLVRFNGVKFTVFDRSNTPELPDASIINLYLDRSGRLWVSTVRGVACVKDGQWRAFRQGSGWIGSYVRFFAEAPSGQLYVTTFDNKLLRFRGDGFEELAPPPADPKLGLIPYIDELGDLWIVNPQFIGKLVNGKWQETISAASLLQQESPKGSGSVMAGASRDGGLWIVTRERLRKYRAGHLVSETRAPWPMQDFWNLHEDSAGTVWINSWNAGLYRYSSDGEWQHYANQNGLSDNFVRDVFEDREGNVWIGTDNGGLIRFKQRNFVNWGTAEGLPETEIDSVAADRQGRVFIGTKGHGVVSIDGGKVSQVLKPSEMKSPTDSVISLLLDRNGRLWAGTLADGLYVVGRSIDQRLPADSRGNSRAALTTKGPIYSLLEDSHGMIWIGTDRVVIRFDGKQFKEFPVADTGHVNRVFNLAEDPQSGTLWAGSSSGGLFRLEGDHFVPAAEAREMADDPIAFLFADQDGSLWVTTESSGIACLRKGHLTRISEKQGIPARYLGAILDDGQGNLWVGSNRGILRIARAELEAVIEGHQNALTVQVFDRNDGLATVDCVLGNLHTAVNDRAGRLWFLTAKGAATVDPKRLHFNAKPPRLVIEDVLVDGQSKGLQQQFLTSALPVPISVAIPAGSHRLEIHYTALSFTAPSKIRFRYMLEGVGKAWIDVGDHRVVYLQDLKPGSYRFQVMAANNDGVWSDTSALAEIRWKPHFYQTYWFLGMCVLGMVFTGAGAYRLRIQRLRAREGELERLVNQRTAELREEVEERKRAQAGLSEARDQLEDRVRRRTAELVADIAERTRVEAELRRSEDKFTKAFHSSPAAMTISSLETGAMIDVNDSFLKLYGFHFEEVIGHTTTELHIWANPAERERVVAMLRAQGPVRNLENQFRTKTGEALDALFSAEIVSFGGKECILAVVQDITEQKRLGEQLRQSQKMEAIGTLSGGIAHDFNNLLTVIKGYSELVLDREQDKELRAQVEHIDEAAERAASLTRQLLAFSRRQILQPRVFNVNALVLDLDRMLRRLIGEDIEMVTVAAPDVGLVKADPGQLEQVIMNLVVNARDAMPRGGKLTLETGNADFDEAYVHDHADASPGRYVLLAVSDTGVGMDSALQAQIFDPFFTTKESGKGTGLGLSMVYGIVKQSGGNISVYSEPGSGTTIKIYLPRVNAPAEVLTGEQRPAASGGGNETILVAEDDPHVRELARTVLSACGYSVLVGEDARTVASLCEDYAGPIHLLVTDVVMPGLSGREVARQVLARRPGTRVLYMSGYTADAVVHHGVLDGDTFFLPKPFTPSSLAAKVREVLDQTLATKKPD